MNPIATCDLCDAHRDDARGSLHLLPPRRHEFGGVAAFSGSVSTVQCAEDNPLLRSALECLDWLSAGAGGVVVLDRPPTST